jgi:hypothetical protein
MKGRNSLLIRLIRLGSRRKRSSKQGQAHSLPLSERTARISFISDRSSVRKAQSDLTSIVASTKDGRKGANVQESKTGPDPTIQPLWQSSVASCATLDCPDRRGVARDSVAAAREAFPGRSRPCAPG